MRNKKEKTTIESQPPRGIHVTPTPSHGLPLGTHLVTSFPPQKQPALPQLKKKDPGVAVRVESHSWLGAVFAPQLHGTESLWYKEDAVSGRNWWLSRLISLWHDAAAFSSELHRKMIFIWLKALGLCFIPIPLDWPKSLFAKVNCKLPFFAVMDLCAVILRVWQCGMGHWAQDTLFSPFSAPDSLPSASQVPHPWRGGDPARPPPFCNTTGEDCAPSQKILSLLSFPILLHFSFFPILARLSCQMGDSHRTTSQSSRSNVLIFMWSQI